MRIQTTILAFILIGVFFLGAVQVHSEQKGKPYCGHTDPSQYREIKSVHKGAGSLHYMELLGSDLFESNLLWVHRGIIPPRSGIGEHLQRGMEDMFFSFNAPAEFTVNGHTSLLPAGSCVLCPMGSSHGIYNNSDETLEWMNIGVSTVKNKFKVVDFGDSLTNKQLESPAPFKWARFDRSLMKPFSDVHLGKGTILNNKLWLDYNFKTNWFRVGHCILPPGTSIGYHQHNATEEVYYVMSGSGRMTVNDHTWDVKEGDAIPCTLHDSHGLYNSSDEDLEIFVVIVAMEKGGLEGNYNQNFDVEYDALNVKNWGDDLSDR